MTAGLIEQHASPRDWVLSAMADGGWANKSDGMESAPTGRFAIVHNAQEELVEILDAFGEMPVFHQPEHFPNNDLLGHFIVTRTDNSVVYVGQFNSRHQAEDEFERLVARFDKWLAACPDCEGPRTDYELEQGFVCYHCATEF